MKCDSEGDGVAISLNADLVHALIEERFGSIADLAVEWEERVAAGVQRVGKPRNRASIYRWLKSGLPSHRDDVLGFAAALDVDPVALLDIDATAIEQHFAKERWLFQLRSVHRSALAPLWAIYQPRPSWPNEEIAHNYYGRSWCTEDFAHDPQKIANVYAAVQLSATEADTAFFPHAYHFAYRRPNARDGIWRPYGTVVAYRDEVRLISESGDYQSIERSDESGLVVVETYFGPGPAEFRVASLHGFTVRLEVPSTQQGCLRFEG